MTEFKDSINELKKQMTDLVKEYYGEIRDIWIKITELENNQKWAFKFWGFVIAFSSSIATIIISFILRKYL